MTPLGGVVLGLLAAGALVYAWADPKISELERRLTRSRNRIAGQTATIRRLTGDVEQARNAALALLDELDDVRGERNRLLADAYAAASIQGRSTTPAGRRRLHAVTADPTIETEHTP